MMKLTTICDINTCNKEIIGNVYKANLLDRRYDMCDSCYGAFKSFVEKNMKGGTSTVPTPMQTTPTMPGSVWSPIGGNGNVTSTAGIGIYTPSTTTSTAMGILNVPSNSNWTIGPQTIDPVLPINVQNYPTVPQLSDFQHIIDAINKL